MEDHMRETKIVNFKKGSTIIIKEAVNPGFFYVVKEGTVAIDTDRILNDRGGKFHEGDTFGLVSGLTRRPHLSTIFAETDAVLIRVPIENLGQFLSKHRSVALKMLTIYSRELRAWHRSFIGAHVDSKRGNPELLYNDALIYEKQGNLICAARALKSYISLEGNSQLNLEKMEEAKGKYEYVKQNLKMPVVKEGHNLYFEAGTPAFLENEPSGSFFVIRKGSVKISRLSGEDELIVDILQEGEIFGEMAILEHKPRFATAVARTDSEIMELPADIFNEEIGAVILQKLFESLAFRIWIASQRNNIRDITEHVGRLYYMLGILLLGKKNVDLKSRCRFNFSLQDLKHMAGLAHVTEREIPEIIKDPNLKIDSASIEVFDPGILIHSISQYDKYFRRYVVDAYPG